MEAVTLIYILVFRLRFGQRAKKETEEDRREREERGYLDFSIPTWDARCRGAGFGVVDWLVCLCVCLCGGGGGGGLLFVHGVSYVYRYICVYPLGFV